MKVDNGGVERIKGFRFPSPGSQKEARVPLRETVDDVYQISHYSRDWRNLKNNVSHSSLSIYIFNIN
jgi:hypothetical protein